MEPPASEMEQSTRVNIGLVSSMGAGKLTGSFKKYFYLYSRYITYPNGNSLDAEFVAGKIMGHGVFR